MSSDAGIRVSLLRKEKQKDDHAYELGDLSSPVLKGTLFHAFFRFARMNRWLQVTLLKGSKGLALRNSRCQKLIQGVPPMHMPVLDFDSDLPRDTGDPDEFIARMHSLGSAVSQLPGIKEDLENEKGFRTVMDYHRAYRSGRITPLQVAKRLIIVIEADKAKPVGKGVHPFVAFNKSAIMAQAEAATARYEANAPLSILDGVPYAVKDEMDAEGYKTYCGTQFMGDVPGPQKFADGTIKENPTNLRNARKMGMVIIGKLNMHEIGIGTHGHSNAKWGTSRNPYNLACYTGGSSSGTAAAVAMGLMPFAMGADGGGSIRVPSSHCGVFGLKPTHGRVSTSGACPVAPTVGVSGPLAATAEDLMIGYALMAGFDPTVIDAPQQPVPRVRSLWGPNAKARKGELVNEFLRGKRIGIFKSYFDDMPKGAKKPLSGLKKECRSVCWKTVKELEKRGAVIVPLSIPYLQEFKTAHFLTILSEMLAYVKPHMPTHGSSMLTSTQFALLLAENYTATDYLQAKSFRRLAVEYMQEVFEKCDAFVTPVSGVPAPKIPRGSDLSNKDQSNAGEIGDQMKYVFMANLTGLPALSAPAGYTKQDGLPIGLQVHAKWWEEETLLQFAQALEFILGEERKLPMVHSDLLDVELGEGDADGREHVKEEDLEVELDED